jgi:hypothetical protein
MLMKVINLFGAPGSGKSTTAAGLFYFLKLKGVSCELCLEYAKDLVWEERDIALEWGPHIFGEQYTRLVRLQDKVDFVIIDSPLLLSSWYNTSMPRTWHLSVFDIFHGFDNLNFWIDRTKSYVEDGRLHSEEEANEIDKKLKAWLWDWEVRITPSRIISGDKDAPHYIIETLGV